MLLAVASAYAFHRVKASTGEARLPGLAVALPNLFYWVSKRAKAVAKDVFLVMTLG